MRRIYTDKNISYAVFCLKNKKAVFHTTFETFTRLLAKAVCPVRDSLISSHPAQNCTSGNSEHGWKPVAASLNAAGIGAVGKKLGQRSHMLGSYHDFGSSCKKGRFEKGAGQQRSCIGLQGSYEDHFG